MKRNWRKNLKKANSAKYKEMLAADAKRKRDAKAENKPKGLANPERVEVSQLKQQSKALEAKVAELKAANAALEKDRDDWREEAYKRENALTKLQIAQEAEQRRNFRY